MNEIKEKSIEGFQFDHKLSEILKYILQIEYGQETYDSDIQNASLKLIDYYQHEGRHRYSEVSTFVYNEIKQDDYEYIYKNLESIYNYIYKSSAHKKYSDKIFKLYDHIKLEEIRKSNDQNSKKLIEVFEEEKSKVENLKQDYEEQTKNIANLNEDYCIQKQNIDGLNTQIVSVIGIFSAIVITFFGGINFINGIVGTCEITKYRLVFSLLSSGFIIFNTVFMLLWFIAQITDKNIHNKCSCLQEGACPSSCKKGKKCVKEKYPIVYYVNLFLIIGIISITLLYCLNKVFNWSF